MTLVIKGNASVPQSSGLSKQDGLSEQEKIINDQAKIIKSIVDLQVIEKCVKDMQSNNNQVFPQSLKEKITGLEDIKTRAANLAAFVTSNKNAAPYEGRIARGLMQNIRATCQEIADGYEDAAQPKYERVPKHKPLVSLGKFILSMFK